LTLIGDINVRIKNVDERSVTLMMWVYWGGESRLLAPGKLYTLEAWLTRASAVQ